MPRVFTDVAKDVGELHRYTKRSSARDHVGAANVASYPEDGAAHFADASRHALAIRLDLLPAPVFGVVKVHLQRVKQLTKRLVWHFELVKGARQFPQDRLVGTAAERQERVIAKAMQCVDAAGAAVDYVIGCSAGGVHRKRCASFAMGEEPAGHEKGAGMPGSDALAASGIGSTTFPSVVHPVDQSRRVNPAGWGRRCARLSDGKASPWAEPGFEPMMGAEASDGPSSTGPRISRMTLFSGPDRTSSVGTGSGRGVTGR